MRIKRILVGILAVIGAVTLGLVLLLVLVGLPLPPEEEKLPDRMILELDLEKGLPEHRPTSPLARLTAPRPMTVRDAVTALERAADDDRVVGVIARIGGAELGLARIEEIRNAVQRFEGSGKPAVAFAETLGEFGAGNADYFLATAFDRIYLQPSGDVGLTGLLHKNTFVTGALEKAGIQPEVAKRGKFKTAVNSFTEKEYTEAHREAAETVMNSQFRAMVRAIGEARGMDAEQVRKLFDRGPLTAESARDAGLVDELAYNDQARAKLRDDLGKPGRFVPFGAYVRAGPEQPPEGAETLALIYGVGPVMRGESRFSRLRGGLIMGSRTVSRAFSAAIEDPEVKAIVFRVDSPGGSYVASDTIRREVVRARKAGKPVIATMGNLAASGGYFVSMAADKVVAHSTTLTGSIGVFAGKPVTRELWNKLGVTFDQVHTSDHARMWSKTHEYTEEEWRLLQDWLDHVYMDFTAKAAQGRNMKHQEILEVAKGRVWTGEDAKRVGLVDELGGFLAAVDLAKQAADIEPEKPVQFKMFPPPKTLRQMIFEVLFGGAARLEAQQDLALLGEEAETLARPFRQIARRTGLLLPPGAMTVSEEYRKGHR
jgi:protease-4